MTTKPVFPALGAPMSPAWAHGSPRVEELALTKSLRSCNFILPKVVIRWMSVKRLFTRLRLNPRSSGVGEDRLVRRKAMANSHHFEPTPHDPGKPDHPEPEKHPEEHLGENEGLGFERRVGV